MASGIELIHALALSGTGSAKLVAALEHLKNNPLATADEVLGILQAAGVTNVTVAKARDVIAKLAAGPVDPAEMPKRRGRPPKTQPQHLVHSAPTAETLSHATGMDVTRDDD